MREWIRRRPWVWIVILLAASMAADFLLLWIATKDAPPLLPH